MTVSEIQLKRFEGTTIYCNAHMGSQEIKKYCTIEESTHDMMRVGMEKLGLSARAYDRVIKVARTIADLEQSELINPYHISEAIQYRMLDRKLWLK